MPMSRKIVLIVLSSLCIIISNTFAARFNVVGSQNQEQLIRLKSQYDMESGKVLKLPIDVPREYISLFGTLPPRLTCINSPNVDNVYGTGDIILVELRYTIPVYVQGIPSLTLNTGCSDPACTTKEVQSFVCKADQGKFAIRLEDQFLMNLDANITKEELKKRVEEFEGIKTVTITYGDTDDRVYSEGNRACTSLGNLITIVFDEVTFPQYNGDVPALLFDQTNTYADLRGGLNIGEEDTFLSGVLGHSRRYSPNVTASNEVVKGVAQRDGTAYFVSGNETNTVVFKFVAQNGDFATRLEVKSINFQNGYIYSPVTSALVSTAVPYFRAGPRYMSQATCALGFSHNISVTSAEPRILYLTSPDADGVYTQGDVLSVHVVYDLPIKLYGAGAIRLQLSTGAFDRLIPFIRLLNPTTMEFEYTVQEGDTSDDLDVTTTAALGLYGGIVYRDTSTNETLANNTVPAPGTVGSLSANKNLVISTLSPQIVEVGVVSRTGVYTAGDLIDFQITYGNAIAVLGHPRLLIANTPVVMDVEIRTAPFHPEVSYTRAQPGAVLQAIFSLSVNWDLSINDVLTVSLPDFSIRVPSGGANANRTLDVVGSMVKDGLTLTLPSSAVWMGDRSKIILAMLAAVPRNSVMTFTVQARSGLFAPASGVQPAASQIDFSIRSPLAVDAALSSLPMSFLSAVGFESLSLTISPPAHRVPVTVDWAFTVPEPLKQGDVISLFLRGFLVNNTVLEPWDHNVRFALPYYNFTWYPNSSEFRGVVTADTSVLVHSIRLSQFVKLTIPSAGVDSTSVQLSADMVNNGAFDHIAVTAVTQVCALTHPSSQSGLPVIEFLTKRSGAKSSVKFAWAAGPMPLTAGDSVVFVLPDYDESVAIAITPVEADQVVGENKALFTVSVHAAQVTFTATQTIPAGLLVELTLLSDVGLITPESGIRPGVQAFTAQMVSSHCAMSAQNVHFPAESYVLLVGSATVSLTPTVPTLGARAAMEFRFQVSSTLHKGDMFSVTIPGFDRPVLLEPYNHSITSNAQLSTRLNRRLDRLEFTLLADFNAAGVAIVLSAKVDYSSGYVVPDGGFSSTAFKLAIESPLSGALEDLVMSGPCLGFCSASADYSTNFADQPLVLTVALSYGTALAANKTLNFNLGAFSLSATVPLHVTVRTAAVPTKYRAVASWVANQLTVTLPRAVSASSSFLVEIAGLELDEGTTSVPVVSTADPTLGGTASIELSLPAVVFPRYYLALAELQVAASSIRANVTFSFNLGTGLELQSGNFLDISLPGFQVVTLNGNLVSSGLAVNVLESAWNGVSSTLRLVVARYVASTETIVVQLNNVFLPDRGVASNSVVSGIAYSIGLGSAAPYRTLAAPFTTVQPVGRIADAYVDFQFDSAANFNLSVIGVQFSTNADLASGDVVLVSLPGLSFAEHLAGADSTYAVILDASSFPGTATWLQNSSVLQIHVYSSIAAGSHSITVDAATSSLIVLSTGISAGAVGSIEVRVRTAPTTFLVFSTPVSLPCVGVCSAVVVPAVRKAGFPTDYVVSITLGVHAFAAGDVLVLSLPDFVKKISGTMVVPAVDLATQAEFFLNVTMEANSTLLSVAPAANVTAHRFQAVSFTVPQTFGLLAPVTGVRPSYRSRILWLATLRASNYIYTSGMLQVAPVGKLVMSTMSMSPVVPDAVADFTFRFKFADLVSAGDFLRIYLPYFTVPSRVLNLKKNGSSVQVVGVAAKTDELVNVDNSPYEYTHLAYMQVNLLQDIAPGDELTFSVINSSLVRTPLKGIYRSDSVPWVSVVSATSPVTAVQMQTYTRLGSLSPAALSVSSVRANNVSSTELDFGFTVNCPLFSGDSITVSLPGLELVAASAVINATSSRNVKLKSQWTALSSTLKLTLTNDTFVLNGLLSIRVWLQGFNASSVVVYANDPGQSFSVHSTLCPVASSPFDASPPSHLESSAVVLPVPAVAGKSTTVTLSFVSVSPLVAGSIVKLILPLFTLTKNGTEPVLTDFVGSLRHTGGGPLHRSVLVQYAAAADSVTLYFKVIHTTAQRAYSIDVPSTHALSVVVPASGINGLESDAQIAAYGSALSADLASEEANSFLPQVTSLLYSGRVQMMQTVWFFTDTSVQIQNPSVSVSTALSLTWSLSQTLPVGTQVVFDLPGFTSSTLPANVNSSIAMTGSATRFAVAVWDAAASKIRLTITAATPTFSVLVADFPASLGFVCPAVGIPNPANSYRVSVRISAVTVLTQLVETVTVVPVVTSSSLTFIAADKPRAFETEGDPYIMQLSPGHPLNSLDAGAQVVIDNAYYTIADVKDNLMYLLEPYHGRRIFMGYPSIPIYTPPYRFADYHSGSGTVDLIFRYQVRRDDLALAMKVFQPTDAYNTNNASESLDLNGGSLLRYSRNPAVVADIAMPGYPSDSSRSVHTDTPVIKAFFTTTPSGTFSMGQQIDFHVKYNHSVVVQNLTYSLPALLLKVAPWGLVKARYSSGSGTDTIVFVYNVSMYDFQQKISGDLLTTDSPIFQPLRVITGNQFNSLRRLSDIPLIDADVDFPQGSGLRVGIPANISLVGAAEKVARAWTPMNVMGTNFSAGDLVQVYVEFSGPVSISLANMSTPYVLLDVGRADPGVALLNSQVNSTTMLFLYEVSRNDQLSSGLYLTCTCLDYFSRTYIELDGSTVWGSVVGGVRLKASVVLANSSSPAERRLDDPLGSGFTIDREIPYIMRVYSNLSYNGNEAYSPGTVALISVKFSLRVTVRGILRMWLKAQNQPCPARYFSGNNTEVLNFLYVFTPASGVARLDYTTVDALDVVDGIVYRYSDNPQIVANTQLPRPGLQQSLGIQSSNVIDTTHIAVGSVDVAEPHSQGLPYLAAHSLSLSLYRMGPGAYQYLSRPERRAVQPLSFLFENTSVPAAVSTIERFFADPVEDSESSWTVGSVDYTRLILDDSSDGPFAFTPLLRSIVSRQALNFDSYWWTDLQVRSTVELEMGFDRAAHLKGAAVPMNSGLHLNSAFSVEGVHSYFLTVAYMNPFKNGTAQETYRLSYGGFLTHCIAVTADAKSVFSLQMALEEIPSVLLLEPNVIRLSARAEGQQIITYYRIDFAHLPREEFQAVTGRALGASCSLPAVDAQVSLSKQNDTIVFEYPIRGASSIIMQATQTVAPGNYTVFLGDANGIRVSDEGIAPQSLQLERFTADGQLISKTVVDNSVFVPRVVRSALAFGANVPNTPTSIIIDLCFEPGLRTNDVLTVTLPFFDTPNSALVVLYTSSTGNVIEWQSLNSSLVVNVNQAPNNCISELVDLSHGFVLPQEVIVRNNSLYTFSVSSSASAAQRAAITDRPFELVTPVGISECTLVLGNPVPGSLTSINVTLEIESDREYVPVTTEFIVYLPGFYTYNGYSGSVELGGPLAKYFTGTWLNSTSALTLTAQAHLQKGAYTLSVLPVGERALHVPRVGLSSSNAPSYSFRSAQWSSENNAFATFQSLIGYDSPGLFVNLTSDTSSYDVDSLTFSVLFSRALEGPAAVTLTLPFLTSEKEKVVVSDPTVLDGDEIVWRNWEKTLTISNIKGWTDPNMVVSTVRLVGFVVNELGVPVTHDNAGITFSAVSADGVLPTTNIDSVDAVPVITYSSFTTSSYGLDIFNNTAQTYTISMQLNLPTRSHDVFYFDLKGMMPLNVTNARVSDDCVQLNDSSVAGHTIVASLVNSTACKHHATSLSWTFTELIAGVASDRALAQYETGGFYVSWENRYRNVHRTAITDVPTFGITHSALELHTPYAGALSEATIRVLTATTMRTGDFIRLQLPGFNFNWSSTVLTDNYGRLWPAIFATSQDLLFLSSPTRLPPTALLFRLTGDIQPTLPVGGIRALADSKFASNDVVGQGNITIALSRGADVILAQPVQQVTPVGLIHNFDFSPVRTTHFHKMTQSTDASVRFDIAMTTLSPLRAGDVISIELPHYNFNYNEALNLDPVHQDVLQGRVVVSTKTMEITVRQNINTTKLEVFVQGSNALSVNNTACSLSSCTVTVSVASASNPVHRQVFASKEVFVLTSATIKFYESYVLPTQYPTRAPTGLPSSQPSSQPTSEPTGQPSRAPAASAHPSSQPSSFPTEQPLAYPSSQPSAQPSSRPTEQPSIQPTSFPSTPTSQPSASPSSPTSQPSALPSAQPVAYPSSQPSEQPSSLPSTQPSARPSSLPSMQPSSSPTGQPSLQPSSQPTVMPTSFDDPRFMLVIELSFSLINSFSKGAVFSVYAPNLYSNVSDSGLTELQIVTQTNVADNSWNVSWVPANQSFHMIAMREILPGDVFLKLISESVKTSRAILYQNEPACTYQVAPSADEYVSQSGQFGTVFAYGLKNSSLLLSNPVAGGKTALLLEIEADDTFRSGDTVTIELPGSQLWHANGTLVAVTSNALSFSWLAINSTITLHVQASTSKITVELKHFRLAVQGNNAFVNEPSVSYLDIAMHKRFQPTPFLHLSAVSPRLNGSIVFASKLAAQATDLVLAINQHMYLDGFDILALYLPQFWSTQTDLSVVASHGEFSAVWDVSSEQLILQIAEKADLAGVELTVSGLRLPLDGVTNYVRDLVQLRSNSTRGGLISGGDLQVELVGFVVDSALSFSPAVVGMPVQADLNFTLGIALKAHEKFFLHLPGFTIGAASQKIYSRVGFIGTWDGTRSTLTLEALQPLGLGVPYQLSFNDSVRLPSTGVYFDSAFDAVSDVTCALSVIGAAAGSIGPTRINSVGYVGLSGFGVKYDKLSDAVGPLSLRIKFQSSAALTPGDTITVFSPLLALPTTADKNNHPLVLQGDVADSAFAALFIGRFNASSQEITLTVAETIEPREVNVFVTRASGLLFTTNDLRYASPTHYVSASISKIGALARRIAPHSPSTFFAAAPETVTIGNCAGKSWKGCEWEIKFELQSGLGLGESLAISHANLERHVPDTRLYDFASPSSVSLQVNSTVASSLGVFWRPKDSVSVLDFAGEEVSLISGGNVIADPSVGVAIGDIPWYPLDRSVSQRILNRTTIVPSIPRIVEVFATVKHAAGTVLTYEDAVIIHLLFSEPVYVLEPQYLKLMLNTGEFANFLSGNESRGLQFLYTVTSPILVSSLEVFGPGALEYAFSAPTAVNLFSDEHLAVPVPANLTIPAPYSALLLADGHYSDVSVSTSTTATVVSVHAYSEKFVTYATGDVLDVAVVFDRPITVVGTPTLLLSSSGTSQPVFAAKFVNVSSIQWLDLPLNGVFALNYDNESTACVRTSDGAAIQSELVKLSGLAYALPLTVTSFASSFGYRYKLTFGGVAPGLFTQTPLTCPEDEIVANIRLAPELYSSAIFRYTAQAGDEAPIVSYANTSALVLGAGANIHIAGSSVAQVTDLTLPVPSSQVALATTSGVRIHTASPHVISVASNFTAVPYTSGEVIEIVVTYSAPVLVTGVVQLGLNFSNVLENGTCCHVDVPASLAFGRKIFFHYVVQMGDYANFLHSSSADTLYVSNGTILLKSINSSTLANLALPPTQANTTGDPLDPDTVFVGLTASKVQMNATALPIVLDVFSNHTSGSFNAGEDIYIFVRFSSKINVLNMFDTTTGLSLGSPFIDLVSPASGIMTFVGSNGTTDAIFLYTVGTDQAANQVSFMLNLQEGLFQDPFNRTFSSLDTSAGVVYVVKGIAVDSFPARVLRVNSTNLNDTYYPGEVLDIHVVFSEPVYLLGTGLPSLELFLPSQVDDDDLMARYSYGNGTDEIHFTYVVPPPNQEMAPQSPDRLDYASAEALYRNLNGSIFTDVSTWPSTVVNVFLPNADSSYLGIQRFMYIDFTLALVEDVVALSPDGIYSAGDEILLQVSFTSPVMVLLPPVLKLYTGAFNRSAHYVSGNFTKKLLFQYTVQLKDIAARLDYIDTRRAPYSTDTSTVTFALNTVVKQTPNIVNDTVTEVFLMPTDYGGVFMSSLSTKRRVPVYTALALPGAAGSLSAKANIVVDTSAPFVKLVTVPIASGTYGGGVKIPITVTYSAAVVVSGCPLILFQINGADKFATYQGGSGTTVLNFEYLVQPPDFVLSFDYYDRFSLKLASCADGQPNNETVPANMPALSIMRNSSTPQIFANLTMPWVNYIESVVAPVSITGSGKVINLNGGANAPRLVWTTLEDTRSFALGDVIDVNVGYTAPMLFPDNAYLRISDAVPEANGSIYERATYFAVQINATTITFPLVVQHLETIDIISYFDQFSLMTALTCSIIDNPSRDCSAQNLPIPFSQTAVNSLDSLSPKNLSVVRPAITIKSISFGDAVDSEILTYLTGAIVSMVLEASDPVVVGGTPMVSMQLNEDTFPLMFVRQLSSTELLFQSNVDLLHYQGVLVCTQETFLDLNGGNIFREANFLPLLAADLRIGALCCLETCGVSAEIVSRYPVVTQVYSPQSGVFSIGESVDIYVEFSTTIKVIGTPGLVLELTDDPVAPYVGINTAGDSLVFRYTIRSIDYTSALDYRDTQSLFIASAGHYDGIYLYSPVGNISADLTLPLRGSIGSIGRSTNIVINKDRPDIVSAFALPAQATSGDDVKFFVRYSEYMAALDSNAVDIFTSGAFAAGVSSLNLSIILRPEDGSADQARLAKLLEVNGTDVVFVYEVTGVDPTCTIYFASATPFVSTNVIITSAISGTVGPIEFPAAFAVAPLATIDNNAPYVLRVFSPNTSSLYPFGVGDVIDIYVEMSLAVVVARTPTLDMNLNGAYGVAQYVPNGLSSVKLLHFQYTVRVGDSADPLEYAGRYALHGYLLRYSTRTPSIVADLTLPLPGGLGSLGYCCNVVVDSTPPFIVSLIPIKRAGIYGENETIFIIARFNKPVIVEGVPVLLLTVKSATSTAVGGSSVGTANFTAKVEEYDIPIDIRSTDIMFKYVVKRYDNVLSLHHTDENAIVLTTNSTIKHWTNLPTISADFSLRDPADHTILDGRVYRQWKFRYPQTVEVLLRDLYHTKPNSLSASIEHLGHSTDLFKGCCANKVFGCSYPKTRSGTNSTLLNVDTGVGDDFLFSDLAAPNIAQLSIVSQSSTRLSPKRAVDGNVDPLVGDNSVSETTEEENAWWQAQLPAGSKVRAVTIWGRKPQSFITPVVEMVIKSFAQYPEGKYRLVINSIDTNDLSTQIRTDYIDMGASPIVVQKIIESTPGIGNVAVTRKRLPLCPTDGSGCGAGYQSGYGFSYRFNFQSITAPAPNVTIIDILFPGQTAPGAANTNENVKIYPLSTSMTLVRVGYYVQVPEEATYGQGVTPPANSSAPAGTGFNYNAWLTPFWVFLFNNVVPPSSLNASVNASVWFQRCETIGDFLNINLPEDLAVSYIKIQREGYGSLSLAEVEVFEEPINNLDIYNQGSRIRPSALTAPYQATSPFKHTFNNVQFDGRWLVQLTQDHSTTRNVKGWTGALGSLSEAVLIITDLAGVVHSYYQDLRAEVTSLPKYGELSYTVPYTPSPYGDWRENFEVGEAGELVYKVGGERSLGYCYGPDTYSNYSTQSPDNIFQKCPANYGVAPLLTPTRTLGDTPETVYLRNERVVEYQPRSGYLGPDYFTYVIYDGQNIQTHEYAGGVQDSINEVTTHVRKCRPFQSKNLRGINATQSVSFVADGTHVLCGCAQTETSLVNNRTVCDAARETVCGAPSTDPVASRDHFLALCLICMDPQRGISSGECQTQTIRAVSQLTSRGLCAPTTGPTAEPFMDCSTETVTEPGKEASNYLSLKPPTLYGAFERLKNSFGAYGWYHTPQLT